MCWGDDRQPRCGLRRFVATRLSPTRLPFAVTVLHSRSSTASIRRPTLFRLRWFRSVAYSLCSPLISTLFIVSFVTARSASLLLCKFPTRCKLVSHLLSLPPSHPPHAHCLFVGASLSVSSSVHVAFICFLLCSLIAFHCNVMRGRS